MLDFHYNIALVVGALLSALAALLHLCIIVGGPRWYRFFGAGERLASEAAAGRWWPHIVTFGIACVLTVWAAYALSGAGVIAPLPWLKAALCAITAVYLLRGAAGFALLLWPQQQYSTAFVINSSLICLGYGMVHLWGLWQVWSVL